MGSEAVEAKQTAIEIVPFAAEHDAGVVSLILSIQQAEFELPITLEAQPDLQDISGVYMHGNGNFWVALDGPAVVGTVALLDIGHRQVALRKMFVAASHRGYGYGVASRLLETAVRWCRMRAIAEIYLGTTSRFQAAHRFYEKNGFRELGHGELPQDFPVMTVDTKFYAMSL